MCTHGLSLGFGAALKWSLLDPPAAIHCPPVWRGAGSSVLTSFSFLSTHSLSGTEHKFLEFGNHGCQGKSCLFFQSGLQWISHSLAYSAISCSCVRGTGAASPSLHGVPGVRSSSCIIPRFTGSHATTCFLQTHIISFSLLSRAFCCISNKAW